MTLVFTNGVFDILHSGHVSLLKHARSLGDKLIVGINSDFSVRRLKGQFRPIISAKDRKIILSELKCVDEVVVFEEDTPENIIQFLYPDILVKGPECKDQYIPGADFVLRNNGKIVIPDWPIDESTTRIIRRIRELY